MSTTVTDPRADLYRVVRTIDGHSTASLPISLESAQRVVDRFADDYVARGNHIGVVPDSEWRARDAAPASPEQERADQLADGLRQLADFVSANPELAGELRYPFRKVLVASGGAKGDAARQFLAKFARAAARASATVTKSYDEGTWANVDIAFGPVALHVYAARAEVCERVVIGTREVTKEVPDPEALAAVPTIEVTETVEDVEWRCVPLLAERPGGEE